MTDRFALTKAERRELIEAIDGILDLMFVPVRKAADAEIGSIEKQISDLMISEWDETTQAAIKKAAAAISEGPGDKPTQQEIKTLLQVLAQELGPGFVNNTPKKVTELIGAAYIIGKEGVGREVGAKMTLSLEDERAQQILKQHHVFWIGNYYDAELGERIADITRTVALDSGLGRKEVGRQLQKALGQEFQRSEHYWRLLGAAVVHRARNLGGVSGLIDAGVKEYEILSVLDERTSDICRAMDGKVFTVGQAKKLRDAILNAQTPEDIKSISPWHSARTTPNGYEIRANGTSEWTPIAKLTSAQLAARGLALPPYHAFCRTTYVVRSFEDTWSDLTEPFPITFAAPEPAKMAIPPVSQLTYSKSGSGLGGAGKKDIYVDKSGNEYLFKPAESKSGVPETFRAHVQVAASRLQEMIYGGDDFIPVKDVIIGGKTGTLQPIIKNKGDLKAMQYSLNQLPPQYIERIQAEHVIDWLISNHDGHGGQFLVGANGKIYGIDKEQAFRYFPNDKLDWKYHPNSQYGEQEPIYNTMMKDFIAGKLDLNLNHVLPYIQRIEKISDNDYRKILRPYANARFKTTAERNAFLDAAVARKNNIRKDFEDLYSRALSEKLGQKYVFKFGDEVPAKDFLQAPLAAQSFSKDDLLKMNSKALKELGKAHKIAYFQQMTKDELAEALAYPEKAASISAMVKERTRARAALNRSEGEQKPEREKPKPTGVDPFEDLDVIGARQYGYGLQKDSVLVEGQHVQVRKVFNGVTDEYNISFKILPENIDRLETTMLQNFNGEVRMGRKFAAAQYDKNGKLIVGGGAEAVVKSRYIRVTMPDGAKVILWNDYNAKAYRGRVEITVDGYDGKKGAKQLLKTLKDLGIEAVAQDPTPEDEKTLKLARLLAQHRPSIAGRLKPEDRNVKRLSEILQNEGIDPDQVDKWTKKEVWPGYWTYLDEQGAKDMMKAGADHLFAGVPQEDGLIGILKSGGLMSTTERWKNGIIRDGASSSTDVKTGGAESVFTRLVTKNILNVGQRYEYSFYGGPYTIIIKPEVLARTDWYAFSTDNYGASEDYDERYGRIEFVQRLMKAWPPDNEVMFRHGIGVESFEKIVVSSELKRDALIQRLKAEGITQINGKPIEEFIEYGGEIK